MHIKLQLLAHSLNVLKALLVVRTRTSNPNLNIMLEQGWCVLAKRLNDTLESASNVREVCNTTADEQNLSLIRDWSAEHEVKDSASVVVSLRLGWRTRVLTIVGELVGEARRSDGVGVDDGCTTSSNEGPDTAGCVQDGQLEGSTGLGVQLGDVSLLFGELTTEWGWELHWWSGVDGNLSVDGLDGDHAEGGWGASGSPLGTALELSGLIELSGQVEEVNVCGGGVGVWDDDQWIDLEVGELAVDIDSVEAGDEVDEDVVDALWHLGQEGGCDLLVGWVLGEVDWDQELLGLLVNITDINPTLVGEKNPVTLLP